MDAGGRRVTRRRSVLAGIACPRVLHHPGRDDCRLGASGRVQHGSVHRACEQRPRTTRGHRPVGGAHQLAGRHRARCPVAPDERAPRSSDRDRRTRHPRPPGRADASSRDPARRAAHAAGPDEYPEICPHPGTKLLRDQADAATVVNGAVVLESIRPCSSHSRSCRPRGSSPPTSSCPIPHRRSRPASSGGSSKPGSA